MCAAQASLPHLSYPILEVPAPILQEILELDGAIGHKVIVADGGIVEDGQLDLPSIADVGGEVIVPGWAVGLLLGGGLADP